MVKTISMQDMRYLNLFSKVSHITTSICFKYNEAIVFCVPKPLVSRAIGEGAKNIKRLSEILRKKIKVVIQPSSIEDAKRFFGDVVSPVEFKDLEVKDNVIIITAGSQSKAALIGRNKRRLLELQKIAKDYFGKELSIK